MLPSPLLAAAAACTQVNTSVARYGQVIATLPTVVTLTPVGRLTAQSAVALAALTVTLYDSYQQLVTEWPDLLVIATATSRPAQLPGGLPNGLSGTVQVGYTKGAATFSNLVVRDLPGARYNITFALSSSTLGALAQQSLTVAVTVGSCGLNQAFQNASLSCQCTAGTYAVGSSCQTCPSGTYSSTAGALACSACPSGSQANAFATACVPCGAGTFLAANGTCILCAAGLYSPSASATSCLLNPVGAYSLPDRTGYVMCTAGTFLNTTSQSCQTCPPATVSTGTALACAACPSGSQANSNATACVPCGAGTFLDGSGTCLPCPAGQYSPSASATSCLVNPAGAYSLPDRTGYVLCTAGTFLNTTSQRCETCPPATFSSGAALACAACPSGSQANSNATACIPCGSGTFLAGNGTCLPCPAGQYSPSASATSCLANPVGAYSLPDRTGYVLCTAGTFLNTASQSCQPCVAGTYASTTGSTSCALCTPGSYSIPARTSCTPCAAGTFLNSSSQLCQPCSPGSFSPAAGAVACTVNPPGFASSTQTTFTSNVTLAGVSSANFGAAQNATLATSIASTLAVSASAVAITEVTNVAPAGRHLLQASAAVAFAVTTTNNTQASAMRTALNATAAFSGALATSLRSSADPVLSVTTGVITTAPTETALVLAALPCPEGTFLNGLTQACDPCAVGLVTTAAGASTCSKCPLRSAWVSSSACVVCPSNSVTSPANPGQCACDFGYYDTLFGANLTAPVCETCPLGGKCTTGFVGAKAGFWRESTQSAFFYQCREGNCVEEDIYGPLILPPNATAARRKLLQAAGNASVPSNCVEGNAGPLCALCLPGYSLQSGVCAPCDPKDAFENWSEGSRGGLIIGCAIAGVIIIAFALFQPLSPGLEYAATRIVDAASAGASSLKEAVVSCVTCACRSSGPPDPPAAKIDEDAARDPTSAPQAIRASTRDAGAASLGLGGMMGSLGGDDGGGGEDEDEGGSASESDGAVDMALDFQDEMEELLEKLQKYAKIIIKCVARLQCLVAGFAALTRRLPLSPQLLPGAHRGDGGTPRLGCR